MGTDFLALFLPITIHAWILHDSEARMTEVKNETRIDVRKAIIGGVLAWIIQALVMFFHRLT